MEGRGIKKEEEEKKRTCTGNTKSAPGTARKLECTSVSSRSNTRHFFPTSFTCAFGSSRIFLGLDVNAESSSMSGGASCPRVEYPMGYSAAAAGAQAAWSLR